MTNQEKSITSTGSIVNIEQVESIKLIKNTKGYSWEIRLIGIDLKRLEDINNIMKKKYGEENE